MKETRFQRFLYCMVTAIWNIKNRVTIDTQSRLGDWLGVWEGDENNCLTGCLCEAVKSLKLERQGTEECCTKALNVTVSNYNVISIPNKQKLFKIRIVIYMKMWSHAICSYILDPDVHILITTVNHIVTVKEIQKCRGIFNKVNVNIHNIQVLPLNFKKTFHEENERIRNW